jgi:hypothetical protein
MLKAIPGPGSGDTAKKRSCWGPNFIRSFPSGIIGLFRQASNWVNQMTELRSLRSTQGEYSVASQHQRQFGLKASGSRNLVEIGLSCGLWAF